MKGYPLIKVHCFRGEYWAVVWTAKDILVHTTRMQPKRDDALQEAKNFCLLHNLGSSTVQDVVTPDQTYASVAQQAEHPALNREMGVRPSTEA